MTIVNQTPTAIIVLQQGNQAVVVDQGSNATASRSPGPSGPPGPPGPAGASGGSIYEFTQAASATPWTINHNMGTYPDVTILIDVGGVFEEVDADVVHGSPNQTTVTFGSPQSGKARLRP